MQAKAAKVRRALQKLRTRPSEQSLVRYFFSKQARLVAKAVPERMEDFIEREARQSPSRDSVSVHVKCRLEDLESVLRELVPYKVDVESLLGDSSMVGTTFLDDLLDSQNHGSTRLSQLDRLRQEPPELMENSRISRILPIHEHSNDLEDSSGLLRQLEAQQDSASGSDRKQRRNSPHQLKLSELEWDMADFYPNDSKFKLVHFFEPKSNNLYLADLESLEAGKRRLLSQGSMELHDPPLEVFEKREIPDFREGFGLADIPRHHKSVCIPEDCVVITGGLEETLESTLHQASLSSTTHSSSKSTQ